MTPTDICKMTLGAPSATRAAARLRDTFDGALYAIERLVQAQLIEEASRA